MGIFECCKFVLFIIFDVFVYWDWDVFCICEGFYYFCNGMNVVIKCVLVFGFYVDFFWVEIGDLNV